MSMSKIKLTRMMRIVMGKKIVVISYAMETLMSNLITLVNVS